MQCALKLVSQGAVVSYPNINVFNDRLNCPRLSHSLKVSGNVFHRRQCKSNLFPNFRYFPKNTKKIDFADVNSHALPSYNPAAVLCVDCQGPSDEQLLV